MKIQFEGFDVEEIAEAVADRIKPMLGPLIEAAKRMGLPERQKKYLIIEVISSGGCPVQLKVGSRLFFRATTMLDLEKSDPCASMRWAV